MLNNMQFSREATLNFFIKPLTVADNLFAGALGERPIASYIGVKDGDPLSAYTVADRVLQKRPTNAQIDAKTFTPFGNPTVSKEIWTLNKMAMFTRIHSSILTDEILMNTTDPQNNPQGVAEQILGSLVAKHGEPLLKDALNTAFWSHTSFDPETNYTATHEFETATIANYQQDNGFMAQLGTALAAGTFANYKTTSATGGIDVDGAVLSSENANALAQQMLQNANRKLRNYAQNRPAKQRPFFLLSNSFYYALRNYVATKFTGVLEAYLLFTVGADGTRTEVGFMYDSHIVYNGHYVLDEYWETTDPSKTFQHMGIFTIPENLSVGFNVEDPVRTVAGEAGLRIYRRPEPEMAGATDVSLFLQSDYLIADKTLISTAGFEQVPTIA